MVAYIELCRENLVDKIGCFGTSRNVGVESGIRIKLNSLLSYLTRNTMVIEQT